MAPSVTRQEHHLDLLKRAEKKLVGRVAPGRAHTLPTRIFKAADVVNAGAADNPENRLGHENPKKRGLPGLLAYKL